MKVLIIDDSPEKIERIKKSITGLVPEAKYIYAFSYWEAKFELDNEEFDFIVCDMQFPIKSNDRIDIEAGIKMLSVMTRMNLKAKIVVASSSDTVNELLEERGYGHIPAIKASSMYALDNQFKPHLTDFIIEDPTSNRAELRNSLEMMRMCGTKMPITSKPRTAEDQLNIEKAALKREIKALKKSGENKAKLAELQKQYKKM